MDRVHFSVRIGGLERVGVSAKRDFFLQVTCQQRLNVAGFLYSLVTIILCALRSVHNLRVIIKGESAAKCGM